MEVPLKSPCQQRIRKIHRQHWIATTSRNSANQPIGDPDNRGKRDQKNKPKGQTRVAMAPKPMKNPGTREIFLPTREMAPNWFYGNPRPARNLAQTKRFGGDSRKIGLQK
jgi:hypothetical protein